MKDFNAEFTQQILSLKEMAQYLDGVSYMIEALNANVTDFDFKIRKNSAILTLHIDKLDNELFDKFTRICLHEVRMEENKLIIVFKNKVTDKPVVRLKNQQIATEG